MTILIFETTKTDVVIVEYQKVHQNASGIIQPVDGFVNGMSKFEPDQENEKEVPEYQQLLIEKPLANENGTTVTVVEVPVFCKQAVGFKGLTHVELDAIFTLTIQDVCKLVLPKDESATEHLTQYEHDDDDEVGEAIVQALESDDIYNPKFEHPLNAFTI